MKIRAGSAIALGLAAALMMTLVMVVVRAAEVSAMNLEMMNGALLTQSVGPVTWTIGLLMHLAAGVVFALGYALVFEAWGGANWARGLLLAVVHTLLSGSVLAVMPFIHPAIPDHPQLRAPGFLATAYGGSSVVAFVSLHLLFGMIVGSGYRVRSPAAHSPMSHGPV